MKYNIADLFQIAFGINTTIYSTVQASGQPSNSFNYSGIQVLPGFYGGGDKDYRINKKSDRTSWMGTPVIFGANFKRGSYPKFKPNGELEQVILEDYFLPPATLFSFRRAKNVVRTNVLGGGGTVKEIFGFDDWIVDVKGLCLDEPDKSAQEQLKELTSWESLASSIEISGELFNALDITSVVISEFAHNVPQGQPGVVAFQMTFISDEDSLFRLYEGTDPKPR